MVISFFEGGFFDRKQVFLKPCQKKLRIHFR